jgi:hypothetical protein
VTDTGLCANCIHKKEIRSDRGSLFIMCMRSFEEAQYPKYPRLPVLICLGFETDGGNHRS